MPTRPTTSQTAEPVQQLLRVDEVAQALRLDPYTVRRYIGRGTIKGLRVGRELRVEPAELRRYIDAQAVTR